ncbi:MULTISPECIES: sigma-70 family RNA polymerase sigma factor [Enterococcus]|uniref:Sigma-70 family RNA polymerase sigma factor n=3 Tax=Enterococcus TaxID=1350 RepID=A0AAW8T6T2_9ENTE|nr:MULTISPECIES: sigma-70 family RNA polymerase sigma factor [Enterococcus]MCO5452102.1 sigma-70 family RNA polymerase sigma factor [Enterococcus faecium]MDT2434085.1 sigma-70 family RNA polymerase sigma factor [Enterococcus avium]MDT2465578.1 sigma-70 family RNA polymerase sigma factor [Enterococcus avium]MDT2505005.1 sigma-70 family RNA polymerase sigma factor [Enterococcus avium]MDT2509987.1 sigma-70 family RNA polymerase sigma factor [Enterococcus avium]
MKKFEGVIGNIMTEGKSDMVDDKGINYRFIKYIYQAMLNEKMNYIRSSKKKGIVVVHDETLLENAQYQNEQLLEQLTEDHAFNLEEYVNDVDLSNSIAKLTDREKYIVYKRFIEGEKDPAIAKTLGVSSQAVSKQRRKIMKKLKTYFEMAP